jgi:hypothetical protein
MVAGRSPRGDDEQQSSEHQPGAGHELRIEADLEDRGGPGEARGELADVAPGGQVDEEDDGEADDAEQEDDPAEPIATGSPCDQRQHSGDQPERDQQVGVGGARRFGSEQRRRGRRQARVAGLSDLDPAVVDELRSDQAPRCGEDHAADRPFRGQRRARPGGGTDCPVPGPQQSPFEQREAAQEEHPDREQAATDPARPALRSRPESASAALDRRPGADEQAIGPAIDRRGHRPGPAPGHGGQGTDAAPRRCYHRPSLRLLFR